MDELPTLPPSRPPSPQRQNIWGGRGGSPSLEVWPSYFVDVKMSFLDEAKRERFAVPRLLLGLLLLNGTILPTV